MVVAARASGQGEDGVILALVEGKPQGVHVRERRTLDATRQWYDVDFDDIVVSSADVIGEASEGWHILRNALDWSEAAICAEMVGGMSWILETSVDYAKVRRQFGKAIGSYQAVSHRLANLLLETESSRSATYYAAWAVETAATDRSSSTAMAKAYVSDAYRKAAWCGIQTHGGIGFTWEHDMHLYFKRAKATEVFLGDATYHRERVAALLEM
jgi:alkylation response protein AidB-like acyl-CoA dehydrogenase